MKYKIISIIFLFFLVGIFTPKVQALNGPGVSGVIQTMCPPTNNCWSDAGGISITLSSSAAFTPSATDSNGNFDLGPYQYPTYSGADLSFTIPNGYVYNSGPSGTTVNGNQVVLHITETSNEGTSGGCPYGYNSSTGMCNPPAGVPNCNGGNAIYCQPVPGTSPTVTLNPAPPYYFVLEKEVPPPPPQTSPDLATNSLVVGPSNSVTSGTVMSFSARTQNFGDGSSNPSTTRLGVRDINGNWLIAGDFGVGSQSPGGADTQTAPNAWTAPAVSQPTQFCFGAYADFSNTNIESNEGNNYSETCFTVNPPAASVDLIVTSISVPNATIPNAYDQNIPTYHISEDITFNAVVKNNSGGNAADTVTRFRLDLNNDGSYDDNPYFTSRDMVTSSLGPNASQTVSTIWIQALDVGTHKLEVCADGWGQINETNEGNNCNTFVFAVRSIPNLHATITNKPSSPLIAGSNYAFRGFVYNSKADPTGRVPNSVTTIGRFCYAANNVSIDNCIFITPGETKISDHNIPGPIEGGFLQGRPGSRSGDLVSANWTVPNLPAGASYWSVKLCADAENRVTEDGMFGSNGNAESDNCDVYNFTPAAVNIPPCNVNIKANGSDGPISIPSGSSATLSWTSSGDADGWLQASGDWSGLKLENSSQNVGPLTSLANYTLSGYNSNNQLCSDNVTINVTAVPTPPPPTPVPTPVPTNAPSACGIDLRVNGVNSASVNSGSSITLSWTSSNDADGWLQANSNPSNAPGPWEGTLKFETGSQNIGPINSNTSYTLTGYNSSNQPCQDTVSVNITATNPPVTAPPSVVVTPGPTAGPTVLSQACTVDIKANGSDGPLVFSSPTSVNLSWTSSDDADGWLQPTANPGDAPGPWTGTLRLANFPQSAGPIGPINETTTYSLTCYNSLNQPVQDSVSIVIATPTPVPSASAGVGQPWIQTRGGDVHSNEDINTPGGPAE